MIRMILRDRPGTIKLLGQQHAHHAVWQRQARYAQQCVRACLECRIEAVRTTDQEGDVAAFALPAGQLLGQLHGGPVLAAFVERDQPLCTDIYITNSERAGASVLSIAFSSVPSASLDTLDAEFVRVLKPGGELILVNHIGAEAGPRKLFELAFAPIARRLGWRPEFPWQRLVNWAARHGGITLAERRPMPPMGHFSLIRYVKA